jgi:F0F1-type ATP synthase delta subunit
MARPYAKATFEEAKKDGLLQQWSAVLQALSVAVGLRDMIEVINSPKYTDEQVLAILLSVVKAVPACTAE